jgi:hypothetical protein
MTAAVEMARHGKCGKPKSGFPRLPHRLEIAYAIPTFPRHDERFSILKCKRSRFARLLPMSPV